ncbi:MrcB family domain-containing protein [Streptomyces hygroscopicus]|uniref:MrcB family domain-containing protein n=1 Tax=Streptomyces hygroscopicus TaxID=1912 RepID=UPI00341048C9
MDIRELLLDVASTYDAGAGLKKGVPGQELLRSVRGRRLEGLPVGYKAAGYGGKGGATATPWIGVMDPEITEDPKQGLYLAYIFAADLSTVSLTLQQGVTSLEQRLGRGVRRRIYLRRRARFLFEGVPKDLVEDWNIRPDLKSEVDRARSYEAGSVAARTYGTNSMPPEINLREDLWHMAEILQHAAAVERALKDEETPDGPQAAVVSPKPEAKGLEGFRPKDGSDYLSHIPERTIKKSRSHEALVGLFGEYIEKRGFVPITKKMHPKDIVLRRDGNEWLVEAKTVKRGNPTKAVREALGQLYEYSHFLYEEQEQAMPHLLGLFTEDIKAYAPYLEKRGIASIWKTVDGWAGSPMAVAWGMVDEQ